MDSFAFIDDLVSRLDAMLKDENHNCHIYQSMKVITVTIIDRTERYLKTQKPQT